MLTKKQQVTKPLKVPYQEIAKSEEFKQLLSSKRSFIIPWSIFFFIFFFTLPILASYTNILEKNAVGSITWAWVLAFAEFIMTWTLCTLYLKKAKEFDKRTEDILEKYGDLGGR